MNRAVGQYAAIEERASNADVLATEVLQNLEAFDFILFDAAKRNKELQLSNADAKLKQATGSIDRSELLPTPISPALSSLYLLQPS